MTMMRIRRNRYSAKLRKGHNVGDGLGESKSTTYMDGKMTLKDPHIHGEKIRDDVTHATRTTKSTTLCSVSSPYSNATRTTKSTTLCSVSSPHSAQQRSVNAPKVIQVESRGRTKYEHTQIGTFLDVPEHHVILAEMVKETHDDPTLRNVPDPDDSFLPDDESSDDGTRIAPSSSKEKSTKSMSLSRLKEYNFRSPKQSGSRSRLSPKESLQSPKIKSPSSKRSKFHQNRHPKSKSNIEVLPSPKKQHDKSNSLRKNQQKITAPTATAPPSPAHEQRPKQIENLPKMNSNGPVDVDEVSLTSSSNDDTNGTSPLGATAPGDEDASKNTQPESPTKKADGKESPPRPQVSVIEDITQQNSSTDGDDSKHEDTKLTLIYETAKISLETERRKAAEHYGVTNPAGLNAPDDNVGNHMPTILSEESCSSLSDDTSQLSKLTHESMEPYMN